MQVGGVHLAKVLADALRQCRPHFIGAVGFSFLISLLFLAPAIYMLQVYDRVVATGGKLTLFFITLALAAALLTLTALEAIRSRLLVRASIRLNTILSPAILERMMSPGGVRNLQTLRDFDAVRQTLASPIAGALFDAPWTPVFVLFTFLLHPWLGILAVVSIGVLVAVAWRNQVQTSEAVEISSRELASAHSTIQSSALEGGTILALGMTRAMASRYEAQRAVGLSRLSESQFLGGRYAAVGKFLRLFVQSGTLAVGALLAIAGHISAGAIIAGSVLIGRALQPVEALVNGWGSLSSARAALRRLSEALATHDDARVPTQLPDLEGRLDVERVSLRGTEGRPVLFNISLSVEPGEMLGVVGPSGSGKTSLAKVIAGALPPDDGTVRFDGAQRSDWNSDLLGRSLGYLPQEPRLFEGTIAENISRFSASSVAEKSLIDTQIVAAAKKAGVHDLILNLPHGYDTKLGPNGVGLSAGQSQRIALARSLFGEPRILILDEPNAFLDAEGETALIRTLEGERRRGVAIVIIAHRKAVLANVTRLAVLEAGRLKLMGAPKEVVARLAGASAVENAE